MEAFRLVSDIRAWIGVEVNASIIVASAKGGAPYCLLLAIIETPAASYGDSSHHIPRLQ